MKMENKCAIAAAASPGSEHQRRRRLVDWYDTRRGNEAVMEVARQLPTQ